MPPASGPPVLPQAPSAAMPSTDDGVPFAEAGPTPLVERPVVPDGAVGAPPDTAASVGAAVDDGRPVDPWAAGQPATPTRLRMIRDLRNPFVSPTAVGLRAASAPGVIIVAQLDLQDPFRTRRTGSAAPPAPADDATGPDLQDPFGNGGRVQWRPCEPRQQVRGVPLQRPQAVAEVPVRCSDNPGPLRDPFVGQESAVPIVSEPAPVDVPPRSV